MTRFVLVLGLLLVGCSKAEGGYGESAPTPKQVTGANQDQIAQMQRDLITDIVSTLQGVQDIESARTAALRLEEIGKQAEPLRSRRDELFAQAATPEEKMAFGQNYMAMLNEINAMSDEFTRLEDIPGVREVLEPAMEKITKLFEPTGQ